MEITKKITTAVIALTFAIAAAESHATEDRAFAGDWFAFTHVDEFTDERTPTIATDRDERTIFGKSPVFAFSCKPGKMLTMKFSAGEFIGGDRTSMGGGRSVSWIARVDDRKAFTKLGGYTHYENPFLVEVATGLIHHKTLGAFIAMLRGGKIVKIRVRDFSGESHDIAFSLKGLPAVLEWISGECRMPKGWDR